MNTKIKGEIDILKRGWKSKIDEFTRLLNLDFSLDQMLKSNNNAAELHKAKEH
jgi:hypothetical protein